MSLLAINSINHRIHDTECEIIEIEKMDKTSPLRHALLKQMKLRLNDLNEAREKVLLSQSNDTITLRVYGDNVLRGKISNRILVDVLAGFQAVTDSVANSLISSPAQRGKLPALVKELTDFQVTSMFEGSFGIVLEKNQAEYGIVTECSLLNTVLNGMFSIMENSQDSYQLIEEISPLGTRAINHYADWMSNLYAHDVNLEIGWTDESASVRKLNITSIMSKEIVDILQGIGSFIDEESVITGVLTGINIRNGTFEIQEEGGQIIKGKSKLDVLIGASEKMGQIVEATVIKNIISSKAKVVQTTWFLARI